MHHLGCACLLHSQIPTRGTRLDGRVSIVNGVLTDAQRARRSAPSHERNGPERLLTSPLGLTDLAFILLPDSFRSLRTFAVYSFLAIFLACYVLPLVLTSLYLLAANIENHFVPRIIDHVPARSRLAYFKHSFLLSRS